MQSTHYSVSVFPGDGIGHEVTEPCLELMQIACDLAGGVSLSMETLPAGAGTYQQTGEALPQSSIDKAREADAILLAAMGDPDIRYPDGTEVTPQIDLRFEFELRLTCVDKANVFQAFAFFRSIFYEVAKQYEAPADHVYVDAMAMHLVTRPWDFDVMVTENMFGDILSDQGAALIGGMGYAPSADIGDKHAVFQPCHGTAPDIAGKGMANPTAMFLSAAMLLDWLADKHQDERARIAAHKLEHAVFSAFSSGKLRTCELGGDSGLIDVTRAVKMALKKNSDVGSNARHESRAGEAPAVGF